MITGDNFIFTSVRLGFQSSSTKKKAGIMNIKWVKFNENLKVHFFFADANDDVPIIKERKTCFGWVADPPFSIPTQLLVFNVALEILLEVSLQYNQTTVNFYKNHIENTT